MNIENVSISAIKPYSKNAKKHPKEQVEKIMRSIERFGWAQPLVVDKENVLIIGHGRLEAAKKLKMDTVPVLRMENLTYEEVNALRLADNKLNESEWDMELVNLELGEMSDELKTLTGFDDMVTQLEAQEDDFDTTPPVEPKAQRGDVYALGEHRLMCGDSTKIEDVELLMNGQKADMVFTSPPYNADTRAGDGDIFSSKKSKKLYGEGYSDNLGSDQYLEFTKAVLEVCFEVTDGFIFWNVSYNANSRFEYIAQIADRLPFLIEQICWKKTSSIPFKGSLMRDWEPIYLFSTNGKSIGVDTVVSNHWQISNTGAQQENHKACFPVALPAKAIGIVKSVTGILFEPFGGSGSTLIACEQTNRKCYMMELDPKYVDVIIARWEKLTGKQAVKLN